MLSLYRFPLRSVPLLPQTDADLFFGNGSSSARSSSGRQPIRAGEQRRPVYRSGTADQGGSDLVDQEGYAAGASLRLLALVRGEGRAGAAADGHVLCSGLDGRELGDCHPYRLVQRVCGAIKGGYSLGIARLWSRSVRGSKRGRRGTTH